MNNGRIGDVFEYISRGKSPQYVDQSSVHVINQACIRWDGIDFSKVKYQNPTTIKIDAILSVGDLLISSTGTGTLGRCCVFDGGDESITYVADSHVTVVRKSNIVLPSFAKYYLMHDATQRELYAQCVNGSTNQIELSKEKFKKFLIPVPSREVQQSIVTILEKIEELIALRKTQLEKLDQLIKSRFIELFGTAKNNHQGYPIVKIGECAKLQGGFAFKSSDYVDDGIRLVQISNVNKDTLDWDSINCVPQAFLQKYKDFELQIGDLVLAMTRPVIKSLDAVKIATISEDDVPSLLNQRVGRFVIDKTRMNSAYLRLCCQMAEFREYVEAMSGNSLQPNISSKQVENYSVVLPPLGLQKQFTAFVEQTDKSKLAIQASLDKLELLKKSLMQEYFG